MSVDDLTGYLTFQLTTSHRGRQDMERFHRAEKAISTHYLTQR